MESNMDVTAEVVTEQPVSLKMQMKTMAEQKRVEYKEQLEKELAEKLPALYEKALAQIKVESLLGNMSTDLEIATWELGINIPSISTQALVSRISTELNLRLKKDGFSSKTKTGGLETNWS
jgi:hypothetical protein